MSLLNRMLKDLEKRQATRREDLPAGVQPLAEPQDRRGRLWLWLIGAVVLVLLGLGLVWYQQQATRPSSARIDKPVQLKRAAPPPPQAAPEDSPKGQPAASAKAAQGETASQQPDKASAMSKQTADIPQTQDGLAEKPTQQQKSTTKAPSAPASREPQAEQQQQQQLVDLRSGRHDNPVHWRLVLELAQQPAYRWQLQENGQVLQLRLENAPVVKDSPSAKALPGIASVASQALASQGRLRVRFQQAVTIEKSFVLQPMEGYPWRLVLDAYPQTAQHQKKAASSQDQKASGPANSATQASADKTAAKAPVGKWLKQAQEYQRQQRPQQARRLLQKILEADPGHKLARQRLVTLLLQQGQLTEAQQLLAKVRRQQPEAYLWRRLQARLWWRRGQHQQALALLQQPPQPDLAAYQEFYALKAVLLQRQNQQAQASALFQRLLEHDPRQPRWWLGLGLSYTAQGKTQQATKAYKRALGLPGLEPDIRQRLRRQLRASGQ